MVEASCRKFMMDPAATMLHQELLSEKPNDQDFFGLQLYQMKKIMSDDAQDVSSSASKHMSQPTT